MLLLLLLLRFTMPVVCPECEAENDEDAFEGFCESCGAEFEAGAGASNDGGGDAGGDPYDHIVVGRITGVEAIPKKQNLVKLAVDIGGEEAVQIVTNAKHMEEGRLVVVACVGAKVGGEKITKAVVRADARWPWRTEPQ